MLDIQSLLGDIGVSYWTSGKNVTSGWTSVSCPACGDRSNHGAFSPNGKVYSCFRCGKHSLKKILSYYTSWEEAGILISNYSNILNYREQTNIERASRVEWPPPNAVKMPSLHAQYLHKRGYDPQQLRELYDIQCCYHTGDMKYRIVIPVYQNGIVVSYVGRDVTGKASLPYKNLAERNSILPVKETVFNLDSIHKTAIICEGPFDAMRFGTHGVCIWGLQYTATQTKLLASHLERCVICFDSESVAKQKAHELGSELAFQGVDVEILTIDAADPGELSKKEAEEIKQELSI